MNREQEQLANQSELSIISRPQVTIVNSNAQDVVTSVELRPATSSVGQQQLQPADYLQSNGQWMMAVAAQTTQGMRQRMSLASDQLGHSLRQLYASASSITDVPPSYHNIPGIVPYYHGRSSGPPPTYDEVINPYAPPPTYQSLFGQMREARKTSRDLLDLLRRLLIILVSTLGCTILIAFMILIPFTMIIVGAVYIDECRIERIPAFLLVGGLVWASKNILHCYAQCREEDEEQPAQRSTTDSSFFGFAPDEINGTSAASASASASATQATSGAGHQRLHLGLQSNGRASSSSSSSVSSAGDAATGNSTSSHRLRQQHHQNQHRRSSRQLKSSICESLLNCILFGWFIAGCVIVFRNYEPDFENTSSSRYCHRTVYMYTFWLIASAILICVLFIGCVCCLMVSSAIASRQEDDLA